MELPRPSGCLASRSDVASIGLTRSLRVVSRPRCRNTGALRLRGIPTAAHPNARKRREFPSRAWALLHSFTDVTPHGRRHRDAYLPCSVRGSFPFSVLPVARSHLPPAGSQPTGYVAPSGFRTLSALCSPRDLPGLFHPGSAPGVPLRGLSPRGAVRPLERRTPPVFGSAPSDLASPSGIEHTTQILHAGLGFSQVTAPLPPWDWPLRGFLLRSAWTVLPDHVPSRASPGRPRADLPVGAPGYQPTVAQPISLETGRPPWGFPPRRRLDSSERLRDWDIVSPRRRARVAAGPLHLFVPRLAPAGAHRERRFGDGSERQIGRAHV